MLRNKMHGDRGNRHRDNKGQKQFDFTASEFLTSPVGRAMADKFNSSYPDLLRVFGQNHEALYRAFAKAVQAGIIRITCAGDNIHMSFHPEAIGTPDEIASLLQKAGVSSS